MFTLALSRCLLAAYLFCLTAWNASPAEAALCSPGVSVPYTQYWCDGVEVSLAQYLLLSSRSSCNTVTGSVCVCPADKIGANCRQARGFTCNVTQTHPPCNPDSLYEQTGYNPAFDGDPPCVALPSAAGLVNFTFAVHCGFTDASVVIPSGINQTRYSSAINSFSYWLPPSNPDPTSGAFGLSTSDPQLTVTLRAYNWDAVFSDTSASIAAPLAPVNLAGPTPNPIPVSLNLSKLSSAYFPGGRLYMETGVSAQAGFAFVVSPSVRITVDVPYAFNPPNDIGPNLALILSLSFLAAVAIAAALVGYFCWRRIKRKHKRP